MRMTEQQKSSVMQYAIIVGMLVMLFLMFFRGWGLTFKFFAPEEPGALPITVIEGRNSGTPNLVPAEVIKGNNGANYMYTVTVQNNGNGDAGSFSVTLINNLNSKTIGACTVNGIEAGDTGTCIVTSQTNAGQVKAIVGSNAAVYNTP